MRNLLLLICCLGLVSCSVSGKLLQPLKPPGKKNVTKLFNIRIKQWDSLKFSGILALRQGPDGLHYVLLDATGIKLIEAKLTVTDGHRLMDVKGVLKASQLPDYLGLALKRIYLLEPSQAPCSRSILLWFCSSREADNVERKYVQAGPFMVWQVLQGGISANGQGVVVYTQPWLGMRIDLENLQPSNQDITGQTPREG